MSPLWVVPGILLIRSCLHFLQEPYVDIPNHVVYDNPLVLVKVVLVRVIPHCSPGYVSTFVMPTASQVHICEVVQFGVWLYVGCIRDGFRIWFTFANALPKDCLLSGTLCELVTQDCYEFPSMPFKIS